MEKTVNTSRYKISTAPSEWQLIIHNITTTITTKRLKL